MITTALKNTVHKSAERLPCHTTLCDMMIESLKNEEYTFPLLEDLDKGELKLIKLGVICCLHVATCKATLSKY